MNKALFFYSLNRRQTIRLSVLTAILIAFLLSLSWEYFINKQGKYQRAEFSEDYSGRFTKISESGQRLSPWSGPWSCVLDTKNSLFWEVKTDNESIHDGYWSYSWMINGNGVANKGDCYVLDKRCDTEDIIEISNQKKLCGRTQWRLPSINELQSLIHQGHLNKAQKNDAIKINTALFPNMKRGDYWSDENHADMASAFNFLDNKAIKLHKKNAAFTILVSQ